MRPYYLALCAVVVHLVIVALGINSIEPFYTFLYAWAWWSFLVAVAGLNKLRYGNSILLDNYLRTASLALFSVFFWSIFEAYNFRLNNWSYFGLPVETHLRWPGFFICFATVIPAVLETEKLLENLGMGSSWKGLRLAVSRGLLIRFVILGSLMMIAPLVAPHTFFPLIWVGPVLLLDSILCLLGRTEDSLLAEAAGGDFGRLGRLAVCGLLCGVLWEFWNYWSGAKWMYRLPFLGSPKIFEMPIAGYFGFPFFAMGCYLFSRLLMAVGDRFTRLSLPIRVSILAVVLALSALVFYGIDQYTIVTYKILLSG